METQRPERWHQGQPDQVDVLLNYLFGRVANENVKVKNSSNRTPSDHWCRLNDYVHGVAIEQEYACPHVRKNLHQEKVVRSIERCVVHGILIPVEHGVALPVGRFAEGRPVFT